MAGLGPAKAVLLIVISQLLIAYLIAKYITTSKLGRVLVSIRDAESRTRFMGYRVEHYKLLVFVVSAVLAGIAGALYVPQIGIINPSEFNPLNSIEIVIWVAIGGRGTLFGAVLGAVLVNYGKTYFTGGIFAEFWLCILGALFVITTIYLPRGVVGIADNWLKSGKFKKISPKPTNIESTP